MKTIPAILLLTSLGLAAQSPTALPPSPPASPSLRIPARPSPGPAATRPDDVVVINPSAKALNIETAADDTPTNTFNFPGIDINQFLTIYADLIGRTILRPTALTAPTITLKTQTPLTRKESIQAFDTLLAMNGITIIKVGEKFVKAVSSATAFQEAASFSKQDPATLPESGQYVVHLVQLKYCKPSELMPVLQPLGKIPSGILPVESSQILVIRDYAENVKRMLEMIERIDISVPAEFISEVIPIKYALASEIASALNSLSSGGGGTTVGQRAARPTRPTAPGFPSATPGAQSTAMPGTAGALGATPAGGTSLSDRLRSIIQRASTSGEMQIIGQNKIIADERTNSLLVFATRQDMAMIKEIIAKLDVVLAQVIIEALIMEVSLGDSLNYGVSWLKQPVETGQFSQAGVIQNSPSFLRTTNLTGFADTFSSLGSFGSGLSWWGKFGNDFDVAVSAAAEDSRVNVLSRPRIQTSHAVPANITIGISRPVMSGTYSYYGGPQSQFQYRDFGISLNVTPLINPDGLVVMDIDQSIQNPGREIKVDANFSMPEVTTRSANAKVAVQNRETVMLGGFISTRVTDSKSGVPLLKDIPLLGNLFNGVSKSHDRTELIVLIRPTVLPTPEIAAKVAAEERNRLPGIRRAEAENQIQEQKRSLKEEAKIFGRAMPVTPEEKKALDAGEPLPK